MKKITFLRRLAFITITSVLLLGWNQNADAQTGKKAVDPAPAAKIFTIKVSPDMDPDLKTLLDGKTIKEGENSFKILSSDCYLKFIVTNGRFEKCLFISPKGPGTVTTTDITHAKKKKSDPDVDACRAAYIMCIARCAMTGDRGCPHCENEFFHCRGIDIGATGITVL